VILNDKGVSHFSSLQQAFAKGGGKAREAVLYGSILWPSTARISAAGAGAPSEARQAGWRAAAQRRGRGASGRDGFSAA
jgi:hypothetical protein